MHKEVKTYCESIKAKFPEYFKWKTVLDVGSLDINGNNRYLFENCEYVGYDLWEGSNVDYILDFSKEREDNMLYPKWNVVISTEMMEHCDNAEVALKNMVKSLVSWWLLLITAAWEWRQEHWTTKSDPQSAPFTNNHYKNIIPCDFDEILDEFKEYEISALWTDIRFCWIKK